MIIFSMRQSKSWIFLTLLIINAETSYHRFSIYEKPSACPTRLNFSLQQRKITVSSRLKCAAFCGFVSFCRGFFWKNAECLLGIEIPSESGNCFWYVMDGWSDLRSTESSPRVDATSSAYASKDCFPLSTKYCVIPVAKDADNKNCTSELDSSSHDVDAVVKEINISLATTNSVINFEKCQWVNTGNDGSMTRRCRFLLTNTVSSCACLSMFFRFENDEYVKHTCNPSCPSLKAGQEMYLVCAK